MLQVFDVQYEVGQDSKVAYRDGDIRVTEQYQCNVSWEFNRNVGWEFPDISKQSNLYSWLA